MCMQSKHNFIIRIVSCLYVPSSSHDSQVHSSKTEENSTRSATKWVDIPIPIPGYYYSPITSALTLCESLQEIVHHRVNHSPHIDFQSSAQDGCCCCWCQHVDSTQAAGDCVPCAAWLCHCAIRKTFEHRRSGESSGAWAWGLRSIWENEGQGEIWEVKLWNPLAGLYVALYQSLALLLWLIFWRADYWVRWLAFILYGGWKVNPKIVGDVVCRSELHNIRFGDWFDCWRNWHLAVSQKP